MIYRVLININEILRNLFFIAYMKVFMLASNLYSIYVALIDNEHKNFIAP